MSTLDKIMEMQKKGITDAEISAQLQNEGISPTEINDSLNQAKIKNAVSPPEPTNPEPTSPEPAAQQEMQASVMPIPEQSVPQQPAPAQPTTQEMQPQPAPEPSPQPPAPNYPEQDYYQPTPQAYSQQDYYAPQAETSIETISEIAEQVATEKLDNYKNKIGDMVSFKNTIQEKVDDIDDRLKRIENSIDKLQQAIIGKIGEFGESNAVIHKDLDNLHNTVSKLMNPLIDNINEMKK